MSNANMQVQIVNHQAISKELGVVGYDHGFTYALNYLEEIFAIDEPFLRAFYVREKFWQGDLLLLDNKASLQRAIANLLLSMTIYCPKSFDFNNDEKVNFFVRLEGLIDNVYLSYPLMFNHTATRLLRELATQGYCLINPYTTSFTEHNHLTRAIAFCSSFDAVKRNISLLDCVIEHGENICGCLTDVFRYLFQVD